MLLDTAETDLLTLLGHLDEVSEAFPEFRWTLACALYVGDANSDVWHRKGAEVLPRFRIGLDRFGDILSDLKIIKSQIGECSTDIPRELSGTQEEAKPLDICLRVLAPLAPY